MNKFKKMPITKRQLNFFLMFKVPAAWICGVRIKEITKEKCRVGVKYRWINQNPFNSMYFAVQAMAAELSTGALVMREVKSSNQSLSMLVKRNDAIFTKKAVGKINFTCTDGEMLKAAIKTSISSGEGQSFWMRSIGRNEIGEEVSTFNFEWTVKPRN